MCLLYKIQLGIHVEQGASVSIQAGRCTAWQLPVQHVGLGKEHKVGCWFEETAQLTFVFYWVKNNKWSSNPKSSKGNTVIQGTQAPLLPLASLSCCTVQECDRQRCASCWREMSDVTEHLEELVSVHVLGGGMMYLFPSCSHRHNLLGDPPVVCKF